MAGDDQQDLILVVNQYKSIALYLKHYTPEAVHAYGQGVVRTAEVDHYRIFVHISWKPVSENTQSLKRLPWETMWVNHSDKTQCIAKTVAGTRCLNRVTPNPYEHQQFNVFCKTHLDQKAKEQHQKGYPMREVYGEFWNYPADARVITTNGAIKSNGAGVMGAGVAKQAKERYPGIDQRLGEMLTKHGNRPVFLNRDEGIVSMPVKHHWKDMADLDLIRESAIKLVEMADKWEWQTVVVPRPGCGNGGRNWEEVKPILEEIWDDRFHVITWEEPEMNYKNKQCEAFTKKGVRCKSGAMKGEDYCGPHLQEDRKFTGDICSVNDCENPPAEDQPICEAHIEEAYTMMEQEENVTYITITGHRPNKLGGYNQDNPIYQKVYAALEQKMLSAVNKFDNVVFRIGMAIGTDQMAAHLCVKHGLTFDAYLPCYSQEKMWPKHVQDEYRKLLTFARDVYYTHDAPYPGAWVMQKRNEHMVDGANGVQTDYVLSVNDGSPGGTNNCVRYAQSKGVRVTNINPKNL